MDQGTKTNDAIRKLQEIFTPRQLNETSTRVTGCASTMVTQAATRVELPTIDNNEIGATIMKKYNNTVQRGEVTHYFENKRKNYSIRKWR